MVLGRIAGPFGVQGWVKVNSFTESAANILDYATWQIRGQVGGAKGASAPAASGLGWTPIKVEDSRLTGKGVLAKLAGIDSPEVARTRSGWEIGVWRGELPPAAPGEYYWTDLEGLAVWTPGGERLGAIDHFRSTPGGTVVVVRGEREHWIPFVKDRIVEVDVAAARVVLDWPADF